MKVNLGAWFQVVEYTLARQLLCLAGMGARRTDGDHILAFLNPGERGFYVSTQAEEGNKLVRNLNVDEGIWSDALHVSTDNPGLTVSRYSDRWCEYVDAVSLMGSLVAKLVPDAKLTPSAAMGAGRRQQDAMDQYSDLLRAWSKENPEHKIQFI